MNQLYTALLNADREGFERLLQETSYIREENDWLDVIVERQYTWAIQILVASPLRSKAYYLVELYSMSTLDFRDYILQQLQTNLTLGYLTGAIEEGDNDLYEGLLNGRSLPLEWVEEVMWRACQHDFYPPLRGVPVDEIRNQVIRNGSLKIYLQYESQLEDAMEVFRQLAPFHQWENEVNWMVWEDRLLYYTHLMEKGYDYGEEFRSQALRDIIVCLNDTEKPERWLPVLRWVLEKPVSITPRDARKIPYNYEGACMVAPYVELERDVNGDWTLWKWHELNWVGMSVMLNYHPQLRCRGYKMLQEWFWDHMVTYYGLKTLMGDAASKVMEFILIKPPIRAFQGLMVKLKPTIAGPLAPLD